MLLTDFGTQDGTARLAVVLKTRTFHGRDVSAYTGARLAAGVISFEEVGPELPPQSLIGIPYHGRFVDEVVAPYERTFGDVPVGKPLVYVNSLLNLAVALNRGSDAAGRKIDCGPDWSIEIGKD